MKVIFWMCLLVIFYVYAGYPVMLSLLAIFKKRRVIKADITPSVSLIVAAYNEGKAIEEKIKNSMGLEYPKDKFEVIIASDCSTDMTDEIVRRYSKEGIILARLEGRRGKTAVQNQAVMRAKGEILVFSDATTIFAADCIKKIVRSFADPNVGCVGGKIVFKRGSGLFTGEKNMQERYDEFIRAKEARIKTTFGLTGCLYAVRKNLYAPLEDDQTSDFVLPLKVIEKGFSVVCDSDAVGYEEVSRDVESEFNRRVRTTRAGMKGLSAMTHMLFFSSGPFVSFGLLSHKVLRWLTPYLMLGILLINIAIFDFGFIYKLALISQALFYVLVVVGFKFERAGRKPKIFTIPFNFAMINIAAVFGLIRFLMGRNQEIWQTERA